MTTLSMKWSRGIRRKYTEEHYAVNRGRWVGSCRWASRAARAAPRCRFGPRPRAARRRADRGDPSRRRHLFCARREALARRFADHRHDAYRHSGIARRQGRRLAREGQRRRLSRVGLRRGARPLLCFSETRFKRCSRGRRGAAGLGVCSFLGQTLTRRRRQSPEATRSGGENSPLTASTSEPLSRRGISPMRDSGSARSRDEDAHRPRPARRRAWRSCRRLRWVA